MSERKPRPTPPSSKVPPQGQRVLRALEDDIASGRLVAGARLDEREIGRRLAVSRTPVREALNRLASAGLVETRPNLGSFVAQLSFADFLAQYEFMADLEALAARLAARRIGPPGKQALADLVVVCQATAGRGDAVEYQRVNRLYHDVIYAAAQNPFLENAIITVRRRLDHYRAFSFRIQGRLAASAEEHAAIAAAILAGQFEQAGTAMRFHMELLRPEMSDYVLSVSRALSPS